MLRLVEVVCGFLLEVFSILVVVCLVNWWLLLPTAVVACPLFLLRGLFLSTSRELKRIEAIARSQSLNHTTATVGGLATIRSTKATQITLAREFDKLQDLHSSSWTLVLETNRAFGLWMDMVCCLYLGFVTFSFFLFAGQETMGGNVGLAITQVIGLVGMCQYGMRQTAEVENQMTSVERMLEYTNLPPEKPVEVDTKALKMNHPGLNFELWPEKGEIAFEDVSLEYEKPPKKEVEAPKDAKDAKVVEAPTYAIRGVSFVVRPAEKVAVVGRTGAGKSSLIQALFSGRIVESGHPFELLQSGARDAPRRSLLSKSQAPLAIPENFTFEQRTERDSEQSEALAVSRDRTRTYSNRLEASEGDGGIFKSLVEQTGRDTAALLYQMAEEVSFLINTFATKDFVALRG